MGRDIVPLGQATTPSGRPTNTPKEDMHTPTLLAFLVVSGIHAGKMPYNTEHLKGFYTERICGTVFTDRCKQISTRIVCGQDYCAQLAPYHAVLDMKAQALENPSQDNDIL